MKRIILLVSLFVSVLVAGASTNTISSASTNLVLTGVYPSAAASSAPTNRVETEGALVQENHQILQRTVDGWVICPRARRFVILQFISGSGVAAIRDSQGEIIRLSSAVPVLVLTGSDTLTSPVYVNAVGGDVVISYCQR